ncbi:hypothetical protein Tco_0007712 [Tanacetum coccineum]
MAWLSMCGELRPSYDYVQWEPMFILYCHRSMGEDYRLVGEINMMAREVNSVVIVRDQFLEELDRLVSISAKERGRTGHCIRSVFVVEIRGRQWNGGTDIREKDEKSSKNGQNRARNGKAWKSQSQIEAKVKAKKSSTQPSSSSTKQTTTSQKKLHHNQAAAQTDSSSTEKIAFLNAHRRGENLHCRRILIGNSIRERLVVQKLHKGVFGIAGKPQQVLGQQGAIWNSGLVLAV